MKKDKRLVRARVPKLGLGIFLVSSAMVIIHSLASKDYSNLTMIYTMTIFYLLGKFDDKVKLNFAKVQLDLICKEFSLIQQAFIDGKYIEIPVRVGDFVYVIDDEGLTRRVEVSRIQIELPTYALAIETKELGPLKNKKVGVSLFYDLESYQKFMNEGEN